ncbi:unnamed protein product [Triticum turgidum subsp. durum]|uniref:Small ribosomal subunit protein mS35 mitochondrial conserved domain-containing protein n=1 Tax=Triticum turgidum subsp. durum TaxID=4567 RepID=A0A9R0VNS7_TRITD|nr:unnamed protein product [Triticum turgidum subsp. durum]
MLLPPASLTSEPNSNMRKDTVARFSSVRPNAAPRNTSHSSGKNVCSSELKRRLEAYYKVEDESELSPVAMAVLERNLADAHSDTDDELIEELRDRPLPQVHDRDIEADFEELYETDEELTDLYNARQYVEKKMKANEYFNMNDTKWDEVVKKATEKATEEGQLSNMKECEDILEDMLHWDKLLPDEIKQKVEAKFNELGDMCERGELEPEQAYELFKEFEDKMVSECTELMEAEPLTVNEFSGADNKSVELNDPPGEGPVLRWESRIVFAPGGDAWHPKNRKVKLSVTVKELGLSRHAFRRLREVVGKRYNSGKDELTIISERFDHREENRKDCLRTLYALVEDAMKADVLANAARDAYVKGRLQANSQFMDRLKMKTQKLRQAA